MGRESTFFFCHLDFSTPVCLLFITENWLSDYFVVGSNFGNRKERGPFLLIARYFLYLLPFGYRIFHPLVFGILKRNYGKLRSIPDLMHILWSFHPPFIEIFILSIFCPLYGFWVHVLFWLCYFGLLLIIWSHLPHPLLARPLLYKLYGKWYIDSVR